MSIFDQLKSKAQTAAQTAINNLGNQRETFTFAALPESVEQMSALPEAAMDTPFKTAALTVCALCAFAADQNVGTDLLNFLRGPRPLNGQDISFIKDRFRGGERSYIIFSYFAGATPENNYTPNQPYTVTVTSDAHSYDEQNYARLYIASGGADSPRPIKLRKKADGQWCLWEQYLLTDIRQPKANDPWA
ncbi:MAG: DUF6935 domain-containing protein [Oscillospiraceae bacterium]